MPRYQVTITRTEYSEATVYVTAPSKAIAIRKANAMEDVEFNLAEGENNYLAELVGNKHEVTPIRFGVNDVRCEACDKPVHWTGRTEKDRTIPGPWVHD